MFSGRIIIWVVDNLSHGRFLGLNSPSRSNTGSQMYKEYLKEAEGKELYEFNEGLIIYHLMEKGQGTYIDSIYIKPEYRTSKSALNYSLSFLTDIKKYEEDVYGEVDEVHPEASKMLSLYLNMGFNIHKIENKKIVLKMPDTTVKKLWNSVNGR